MWERTWEKSDNCSQLCVNPFPDSHCKASIIGEVGMKAVWLLSRAKEYLLKSLHADRANTNRILHLWNPIASRFIDTQLTWLSNSVYTEIIPAASLLSQGSNVTGNHGTMLFAFIRLLTLHFVLAYKNKNKIRSLSLSFWSLWGTCSNLDFCFCMKKCLQ